MKFLLDENLAPIFINKIKEKYPSSVDVFDIGLAGESDQEIYEYLQSEENNHILITFDLDFSDIRKYPPELVEGIIVLRFKNKRIRVLIEETLRYLEELSRLDYKQSLVIFQNSGMRFKRRLKIVK